MNTLIPDRPEPGAMAGSSKSGFDQIELSLFSSRIAAICEEMGALLGRIAFSPNIRDRLDYSCALFDSKGLLLGQATHIPVHLGSMAYAMQGLVKEFDWQAGDMVIFNDPFRGGTHLPDVTFVSPVFSDQLLIGFCANRAHHADIGSDAPGSMPISGRLEEEGIIISPTCIVNQGEINQEFFGGLLSKLQNQDLAKGDFKAQIAANLLGSRRLEELTSKYSYRSFLDACKDLQAYANTLAKASLNDLPHGIYSFTDMLDDDGSGTKDIVISVCITVNELGVLADFTGTSNQVNGNLNCPVSVTAAAVFYAFRCLMPDQVPACYGAMLPIRIVAPEASLVNAAAPAAVAAGNVETSMRVVDVVCGALAKCLPGKIPAASQGTMNNIAMGSHGKNGWDYYETLAGGLGAGPDCNGRSARHSHMTNTLNTPVEVLERHYPLRILKYAQRYNSGGEGQFHGGDGIIREYQFLADAELSIISERRVHAPWGLMGGESGKTGKNMLDEEILPAKCQRSVSQGQCLMLETPGGGGYGLRDR
ncbi:MAG: N-methylhydantoinase B [Lysobacterales bacterium]